MNILLLLRCKISRVIDCTVQTMESFCGIAISSDVGGITTELIIITAYSKTCKKFLQLQLQFFSFFAFKMIISSKYLVKGLYAFRWNKCFAQCQMTEGNVNKYKKNKFDSAPRNGGAEERYSELGKKSTPGSLICISCFHLDP